MRTEQPFGTIESTDEYLALLSERIDEVLKETHSELMKCKFDHNRVQTWQLVLYTMTKLSSHIATSRKLMMELDTLREALHGSRSCAQPESVDDADFHRVYIGAAAAQPAEVPA